MQELGDLFNISHEKVSHLMNQLMVLKRKSTVVPSLEAEIVSLKESLSRAEKRLAESEAHSSEVGIHHTCLPCV